MDKSKAVLEVSVKTVEFIQTELRAAGLTDFETKDVAECLMAAANPNRQALLEQAKKPALLSDERALSDAAREVYSSSSKILGNKLANERFATHVVDKFHPTISRVIEEMVLNGKPEDQIKEAVATTGRAIVAGVRELIRSASTRLKDEPSLHAQVQKD